MAERNRSDAQQAIHEQVEAERKARVEELKSLMVQVIIDNPSGVSVKGLYEEANRLSQESGGKEEHENTLKSAFLDLVSTEGGYLDQDRKVRISSQE